MKHRHSPAPAAVQAIRLRRQELYALQRSVIARRVRESMLATSTLYAIATEVRLEQQSSEDRTRTARAIQVLSRLRLKLSRATA